MLVENVQASVIVKLKPTLRLWCMTCDTSKHSVIQLTYYILPKFQSASSFHPFCNCCSCCVFQPAKCIIFSIVEWLQPTSNLVISCNNYVTDSRNVYLDANSREKCSAAATWSSACSGTVKHKFSIICQDVVGSLEWQNKNKLCSLEFCHMQHIFAFLPVSRTTEWT